MKNLKFNLSFYKTFKFYNITIVCYVLIIIACNDDKKIELNKQNNKETNEVSTHFVIDSSQYKNFKHILGTWEIKTKNPDIDLFKLVFVESKDSIHCLYSSIMYNGDRLDLPYEADYYSFSFSKYISDSIKVKYFDYYTGDYGKVKLVFGQNSIKWEIIEPPKGPYFVPDSAVLFKTNR